MKTFGTNRALPFHLRAAGYTDVGRVREVNEDAFAVDARKGLFIVADGIGGHPGGDIASRIAVEQWVELLEARIATARDPRNESDPVIGDVLLDSLAALDLRVHEAGLAHTQTGGIGTTVVAAMVTRRRLFLAHMGDSRAYLWRHGRSRRLTQDHSVVSLLVEHGHISKEDALHHPAASQLTRFAGMAADIPADLCDLDLMAGDRLLLCTDGLWSLVPKTRLDSILAQRFPPEAICRKLVEAGNQAGGHDNLTAVVVDVDEEPA